MEPGASLDALVEGLSPGVQFLLNLAVLLVAVAAAAFGYFRRPGAGRASPPAAPVEVVGAALADRASLLQLVAALDRLTAAVDKAATEARERDDREAMLDDVLRRLGR